MDEMERVIEELERLGYSAELSTELTKRFAASVARMRKPWWHRLRDRLNRIFDGKGRGCK